MCYKSQVKLKQHCRSTRGPLSLRCEQDGGEDGSISDILSLQPTILWDSIHLVTVPSIVYGLVWYTPMYYILISTSYSEKQRTRSSFYPFKGISPVIGEQCICITKE